MDQNQLFKYSNKTNQNKTGDFLNNNKGSINQKTENIFFLFVVFHLALLSQFIPIWALIFCILLLFYKLLQLLNFAKTPNYWIINSITLLMTFATAYYFKKLYGLEPTSTLFLLLSCTRINKLSNKKEMLSLVFISIFLLTVALLNLDSVLMTVLMIIDIIYVFLLFGMIQTHRVNVTKGLLWSVIRSFFISIPFFIIVFIAFPRFSLKFGAPALSSRGQIGFTAESNPGKFSELAISKKIVFRAKFNKKIKQEDLYWRGTVLDTGTGLHWFQSIQKETPPEFKLTNTSELISYTLTLEPTQQNYLFTLDTPIEIFLAEGFTNNRAVNTKFMTYETVNPINNAGIITAQSLNPKNISYFAKNNTSFKKSKVSKDTSENQKIEKNKSSKELPDGYKFKQRFLKDSQLVELINLLQIKSKNSDEFAENILMYFSENGFRYSLKTNTLDPKNELADFLFNKKVGFCEHFSGAFASLMKFAGYKSRLVVGFMGGEYNEYSNEYIIREADAHAWVEYWSNNKSTWVRIDPTSVVEPLRITIGSSILALNEEELFALKSSGVTNIDSTKNSLEKLFSKTAAMYDAVSSQWSQILLQYDSETQNEFISNLLDQIVNLPITLVIFSVLAILLAVYLFFLFRKQFNSKDKSEVIMKKYEALIRGRQRDFNEGEFTFISKTKYRFSNQNKVISFRDNYIKFKYGNAATKQDFIALKEQVSELKQDLNK